jgi:hypothetical protein
MKLEAGVIMDKLHRVESMLLVSMFISTYLFIFIPMTANNAQGVPIEHLLTTKDEDGVFPYDTDGLVNNIVVWAANEDHHLIDNYTVDAGYTLDIPALNFLGNPDTANEITIKQNGSRIYVYGTLITHTDGDPMTRTLFWGEGKYRWKGLLFYEGSQGCVDDCIIMEAQNAIVFYPGSHVLEPGVRLTTISKWDKWGIRMDQTSGYTHLESLQFVDAGDSAIAVRAAITDMTIKNSSFYSHGDGKPSIRLINSNVLISNCIFQTGFQQGCGVQIELFKDMGVSGNSDGTVLDRCSFSNGAPGDPFVRVIASKPLLDNCSFYTSNGEVSVEAVDKYNVPAIPVVRNPNPSNVFDNSTFNVSDNSSVILQWYMDVNVRDPNDNFIINAPVWIVDGIGNPSHPPSNVTDMDGWARWFLVTEFIQYNDTKDNYNTFTVSALNNSMTGYAYPIMNKTKDVIVIVPFNPIPNIPPEISWITTPVGRQEGYITIEYTLWDPDIGDDGNMSVEVLWSTDNVTFWPASAAPGSDPQTWLSNNTLYQFIWDSSNSKDLPDAYSDTVYIKIVPSDREGEGIPGITGNFTVDNRAPVFLTPPSVTYEDTWALIEWLVNEPADAVVWWGHYNSGTTSDLTQETAGSLGTTNQSVLLSALTPGTKYTFVINSTDSEGKKSSSDPITYNFETEIRIQLYEGWNLISLPPILENWAPEDVFAPLDGDYDEVQWYDVSDPDDPWKHYRVGKTHGNDLEYIESHMGLWIHMLNDAVFIPDHRDPTTDIMFPGTNIQLEKGWNHVGYPSVINRDINTALAGVEYDLIQTYDVASGQWLEWDGTSGDLTQMELGRGYWIHCLDSDIWHVDYL